MWEGPCAKGRLAATVQFQQSKEDAMVTDSGISVPKFDQK